MTRGTILVVDDSPLTLEALRRGLESAGFTVRAASDLADVPTSVSGSDLDLILMDIEMAEAFGDDLAMLLRADDGPPIYLLSALPEAELVDRAAAAGVDGYLPKGAGVAAVVRRAIALLDGGADAAPRDVQAELRDRFVETARRRTRHAGGGLEAGGRDGLRRAAYELHALIGEAAILGFPALAALAEEARLATARALDGTGDPGAVAALLAALDDRLAEAAGAAAPPESPLELRTGHGRRVLLVDDSEIFRATLGAILEDSGYAVDHASSVAEGRAVLAGPPADMVVLDLELADGSGAELMAEVRAAWPRAVVVVLSGGEPHGLPETADLLLLKTLDPTTLLIKLERAIATRCG